MKKSVFKFHLIVFFTLSIATTTTLLVDVNELTGRGDLNSHQQLLTQEIQVSPQNSIEKSGLAVVAESSASSRLPASIEPTLQTSQLFDISEFCKDGVALPKDKKINREFVQLQGLKTCHSEDVTEIVNETNGYSASLLELNDKMFKTDLLRLQKGENKIAIRFKDKKLNYKTGIIKVLAQF